MGLGCLRSTGRRTKVYQRVLALAERRPPVTLVSLHAASPGMLAEAHKLGERHGWRNDPRLGDRPHAAGTETSHLRARPPT